MQWSAVGLLITEDVRDGIVESHRLERLVRHRHEEVSLLRGPGLHVLVPLSVGQRAPRCVFSSMGSAPISSTEAARVMGASPGTSPCAAPSCRWQAHRTQAHPVRWGACSVSVRAAPLVFVLGKCEVPEHHAQVECFFQLGVIVASAEERLDEAHHLRGRTFAAILGRIELDGVVEDTRR